MQSSSWKVGTACFLVIVFLGMLLPGDLFAPPANPQAHTPVHRFLVEIDGIASSSFESVFGIESEVAVLEYRSGNYKTAMKMAGQPCYANIVLRASIGEMSEMWNWYKDILSGNTNSKNMVITLLDNSYNPVVRYKFKGAWPCAWRGPELLAQESEVAIEEVEITFESFMREQEQDG